MTYQITIHGTTVRQWDIRNQWWNDDYYRGQLTAYLVSFCPEIINATFDDNESTFTIEFISEQHYHWFLLQQ